MRVLTCGCGMCLSSVNLQSAHPMRRAGMRANTKGGTMIKARDLTSDERWLYAPWYIKALRYAFIIALPFIGSIDNINF